MNSQNVRHEQPSIPDPRVAILQSETESPEAREAAFADIVHAYEPGLRSSVVSIVGPDRAEDVAQDTFLKALTALDRFDNRNEKALTGWLYKIARNTARNTIRNDARIANPDALEMMHSTVGDPVMEQSIHETMTALAEITPTQRDALMLSALGLSEQEIAEHQGVTASSANGRLVRGRKNVRRLLDDRPKPEEEADEAIAA